jgi:hypothetical protein
MISEWNRFYYCLLTIFFSEKYGMIMKCIWNVIESEGSSWKQVFKVNL